MAVLGLHGPTWLLLKTKVYEMIEKDNRLRFDKRGSGAGVKRRTYRQFCGLAKALDVVGERWSLLLVRNLMLGPQRYGELLVGLPGVTTNLLAKRLRELKDAGVVEAYTSEEGGGGYALTERGRALNPAIQALGAWGAPLLGHADPVNRRSLAWFLVSLSRRYRGGSSLEVSLQTPGGDYVIRLRPNSAEVGRETAESGITTISGSDAGVLSFLAQGDAAQVQITGDEETVATLLEAFEPVVPLSDFR